MRLHYHPLSPYSRKAQVAVLHRRDAIEMRVIDVMQGGLRDEAFLRISPFGKMPALETDDGPIIESTSIIEYLEERGPRALLPSGSERLARQFDRLGDLYLVDPMSHVWRRPASEEAKEGPAIARKAWAIFERQLRDRPFVCGDTFSLGDLGAAIATDYLARLGVTPPASITSWKDRCFEVPAMASALTEAMPFVEPSLAARAARLAGA